MVDTGCTAKSALYSVMNMFKYNNIDAVMGPTCSEGMSHTFRCWSVFNVINNGSMLVQYLNSANGDYDEKVNLINDLGTALLFTFIKFLCKYFAISKQQ